MACNSWATDAGCVQIDGCPDYCSGMTNTQLHAAGDGCAGQAVLTHGLATFGDNGGGRWHWDASQDKAGANLGTIIDPSVDLTLAAQGTGTGTGCWKRDYDNEVYLAWFMSSTSHITSDAFALFIAAEGTVFIVDGTHTSDTFLDIEKSNITVKFYGSITGPGGAYAQRLIGIPVGYNWITIENYGTLDSNGGGYGSGNAVIAIGSSASWDVSQNHHIYIKNYGLITNNFSCGVLAQAVEHFTLDPVGRIYDCVTDGVITTGACDNITIRNGEIDTCGMGGQGVLVGGPNSIVDNVYIHGTDPQATNQIQRGIVVGYSGSASVAASRGSSTSITNNTIADLSPESASVGEQNPYILLKDGVSENVIVSNNRLFRDDPLSLGGTAILQRTASTDIRSDNIEGLHKSVISNNIIRGQFSYGISIIQNLTYPTSYVETGFVITGNHISLTGVSPYDGTGILIERGREIPISGNYIATSKYGIFIDSSYNVITGNHIETTQAFHCVYYKNAGTVYNYLGGNSLVNLSSNFITAYLCTLGDQHDVNNMKNGAVTAYT